MDLNIYRPFQSLQKSPIEVGGACSISCFPIQDVLEWPEIDPLTGFLKTAVTMKPGKSIYQVQSVDKGRSFKEELKYDAAGPFMEMDITGILAGHNSANILSLAAAQFYQWGLIINDRNGNYRLIGNKDSGARLLYTYDMGDPASSRKVALKWEWVHPLPAPIYQAEAFQITVGNVVQAVGCLTKIVSFKVGQAGSPMADGDTVYTNALLAGKKVFVIVGGLGVPIEDGSGVIDWADPVTGAIIRHIEKNLADDFLTFVGPASAEEVVEIYTYS